MLKELFFLVKQYVLFILGIYEHASEKLVCPLIIRDF